MFTWYVIFIVASIYTNDTTYRATFIVVEVCIYDLLFSSEVDVYFVVASVTVHTRKYLNLLIPCNGYNLIWEVPLFHVFSSLTCATDWLGRANGKL